MAPRANYQDQDFTVTEPLELDAGVMLPKGTYPGALRWTEYDQPGGPPRIMSRRFVLPLSAEEVKRFGGKLGRTKKSLEIDVSNYVENGLITI